MSKRAQVLEGSFPLIATRERCQMCHRISSVGFWVPNHVWTAAVHRHWQNSVLCVACFVSQADEKLIPWDDEIKFYPASLRTHLGDRVTL